LQELVTNAESKPIPLAIWVTSAPTIAYIGNFINKADLGRQNAFAAYLIISTECQSRLSAPVVKWISGKLALHNGAYSSFIIVDRFGIIAP